MVAEWFPWWNRYNIDRHLMSRADALNWTVVHGGITLAFMVLVSIAAYKRIRKWNREAPRHIENPALFRQGQLSRL
jgi:hypothetical protein